VNPEKTVPTPTGRFFSLRLKLLVIFGTFSVLAVVLASFITYRRAVTEFDKELKGSLIAIGNMLIKALQTGKVENMQSMKDPYYAELKSLLRHMTRNFNLSWLAMYRFNGKYFTHIADGAEMGGEFCFDYPIFDVSEEMLTAFQQGEVVSTDNYVDSYGTWMSAFMPVRNAEGKVIAIIDSSKNVEQLNRLKKQTFEQGAQLVVAIAIVFLILCFFFSHSLSRPLTRLTEGADQIASGKLDTQIPELGSSDEIGLLVRSFNSMAEQLRLSKGALERKIFELTILYEISQKINFANNTQEIIKLILEKATEVLKAERGSVMLFNEEEEMLVVEVVFGQGIGRIEKRIEIKPGEGVAGRVFQDCRYLIINDDLDNVFKPYQVCVESSVRNILCLPLVLEKKAIGVINMVNKCGGGFSEEDLGLASMMGAQIALTIEKTRLYELSITDGLTKLFVHRYFQIAFEAELKRSRRYSKNLSLILFDIDHFKKFNDTYGHQMGDRVLSETAQIVKDAIRNVDVPARYGGEEFVIILPETDVRAAYDVAERLRKRVEDFDFPGQDHPVKVTISLGISSFPLHGDERLQLIKKADDALYGSKERGRNCTTIFDMTKPA
jgi:diguanylate cyclase (GGDEF)-like protein